MTTRAFNPVDFLKVADSLVSLTTDEACLRTCVGRCYYAAFLTARERLTDLGWQPTHTGDDHHGVCTELAHRGQKGDSDQLSRLYRQRTHADYRLSVPISARDAQKAQLIATGLLARIPNIV